MRDRYTLLRELGHGGMAALGTAHAALALGLETLLAPRMSSADPRPRHRGLSHHTATVGVREQFAFTPVELAALLADPVHRVAMGWKGRGFVEQHATWDRAAAALAEARARPTARPASSFPKASRAGWPTREARLASSSS